jgi:hypothetical protein
MKRALAALFFVTAAWGGFSPASAQEGATAALRELMNKEIPQERLDLGMQLVKLSGNSRTFDQLLPTVADQAKNAFIRANPQMQLGIIEVVDRIALTLVPRRPELDRELARIWAAGFSDEEMRALIEFYQSDIGKKFADLHPKILAVEVATAQEWGRSVAEELTQKVSQELRANVAAEQNALQGQGVGTGPLQAPEPAPAQ